jgi:YhcH/YjgK/YiaL family protein
MALIGTLEVLKKQTTNQKILSALDYLQNTNVTELFSKVLHENSLKIEIQNKTIFAIFQEYTSKLENEIKMEGHKKYIDIQFVYEGNEKIYLSSEKYISKPDNYDAEKDVYFPKVNALWSISLIQNTAAILFPDDLHGPGYCFDKPEIVKKIVIKVEI